MSDHVVEYMAILSIQRMVDTYVAESAGRLWLAASGRIGPNPNAGQTASGLYLQCDAIPNKLWTPWGLYWIAGDVGVGDWDPVMVELQRRLGASLVPTNAHVAGDVFALSRIDNEVLLPKAIIRPREGLLSYEEGRARWDIVQARCGTEL